ncbi:amino acid ABC transporter permease [Pseudochrobactrum kiredjianiae]|uniref:Amino acid ABC transporter permease n=1 Tax=Pseudochrobactrum kiredjianiae TaxID=386305 RepID=A0ABW3V0Q6_9HYPH|nr:amino acid ABC transporter permease [Pseudochrobactrum kiredjianiae]MDM7852861.1 amino acid ABC transporter permease [Pseudochrobactrum kiredjianiae]
MMFEYYWKLTVSVMPFLWQGFKETFTVSLVAIIAGSLIGTVIGIIRSYRIPILTQIFGGYVHILRGTPFLVQLYVFYFVLPNTGIEWLSWDSSTAAFVALSLYTSCYVSEIVSSAIDAVPRGQWEAATAVGMSQLQKLWHVILPQALKLTIAPMSSVYVIIIKSTAILSVIGIAELTRQGEVSMLRFPRDVLFIYGLIALVYFIYCYPILKFSKWAENKISGSQRLSLD